MKETDRAMKEFEKAQLKMANALSLFEFDDEDFKHIEDKLFELYALVKFYAPL